MGSCSGRMGGRGVEGGLRVVGGVVLGGDGWLMLGGLVGGRIMLGFSKQL